MDLCRLYLSIPVYALPVPVPIVQTYCQMLYLAGQDCAHQGAEKRLIVCLHGRRMRNKPERGNAPPFQCGAPGSS